ncbi:hypothetical protein BGZ83_000267 [Gryganskiella cystojenkinii]|nr:hypothetical protein BGZ83_000267 [Gryganskiella cystojenkinii]
MTHSTKATGAVVASRTAEGLSSGKPSKLSTVDPDAPSPLDIEEILVEIVSNLDRQSLFSCISVSKIFYRASIRILWSVVHWKSTTTDNGFLPEFKRYGHYTVELQDNFNADLDLIARICPNLRELRLAWTPATDEALQNILENSPKITDLYLYCSRELTHKSLEYIGRLQGLTRLDMKNMVKMDERSLTMFLRSCPQLEHLNLEDVLLENIFLDDLGTDKPLQLRTLGLARSYPPGTFIKNILRNSPHMQELSLARNIRSILTQEDVIPLQDMLLQLTHLSLDSCRLIDSDALETIFQTCLGLERVNISATLADDRTLIALGTNCTKLQSLNVSACTHISDRGVLNLLTTCSTLILLDLQTRFTITSAIFQPASRPWACLQLETLNMIGIDMTLPRRDGGGGVSVTQINHSRMFDQLSRLRSLRDLVVGGSTLKLELESGMHKLGQLEGLESLRITALEVILQEDEIRWIVESWPRLKRIKFEAKTLPEPWKRYFRQRRPHLILG